MSAAAGDIETKSGFPLFVRIVAAATAVLIFIGALVTTTGSGLAVPDWPLSFGQVFPRMVGGVLYEHGHRLVAGGIGFLTLVMAFWAQFGKQDRVVRGLCWLALALVVVQGLLGGLTVLLGLSLTVSTLHACTAQLFLCTVTACVCYTSPRFRNVGVSLVGDQAAALRLVGLMAVGAVLCQLVIGAVMRHMGAGLVIVDWPLNQGGLVPIFTSKEVVINYAHRVTAWIVFSCLMLYAWHVQRQRKHLPGPLVALSRTTVLLVCLQITLGALTVWSGRGLIQTCCHVLNGALTLATTFATYLWTVRCTAHVQPEAAAPMGEGALREQAPDVSGVAMRATRKDWMNLFKVKLVNMSVIVAALSYWLGRGHLDLVGLLQVSLGVALIGSGAGALNQLLEVEVDRLMSRTRTRPILSGSISPAQAEFWGCALSILGTLYLGLVAHPLAGLLAALAVVSYAFVYTPLKKISSYCTLIGAVPGALPVLVGWSAATGGLELQGWVLFCILFLWQLPHFMAIAWLCKDDYARAGLPMVTVLDPGGRTAAAQAVAYCLALLPVSLAPSLCGLAGPGYFFVALILGLTYLYASVVWGQHRTTPGARRLLLTSVAYLPLLFGAMVTF